MISTQINDNNIAHTKRSIAHTHYPDLFEFIGYAEVLSGSKFQLQQNSVSNVEDNPGHVLHLKLQTMPVGPAKALSRIR